ncbi:hypothetical protein [Aurantimonas sp. VKM B-3413]|uniref:hypothetical protein n=1 Tax=Aurantimonas sp. VKM B-3413 TaxID=2779401 RepID=UPI001E4447F7|nr:hypothetical protein [Aurantimonas sp. VKM B-3413]MCB8840179.1 hypothetical protein [Aurantimonas sp. VKM B-3413]
MVVVDQDPGELRDTHIRDHLDRKRRPEHRAGVGAGDPDEVKSLVRREDHGGLAFQVVEKRMNWSTRVLTTLIGAGHLPSSVTVNPVNRCPQRIVLEVDLAAFDESFVSFHSLADERGVHFKKLKAELIAKGIEPDPAFADVPATFYSRAAIRGIDHAV